MISLEKKKIITVKLDELLNDIKHCEECLTHFDVPSLYLWRIYTHYYDEMSNLLDLENNLKESMEIFDILNLDVFIIDAKNNFLKNKELLINYISDIKKII